VLPVRFLARKSGRHWLLPSVFTAISAIASAGLAVRAVAQTATPPTQTTQAQATQNQSNLPPIRVTGRSTQAKSKSLT
jgi:hypothetical protein